MTDSYSTKIDRIEDAIQKIFLSQDFAHQLNTFDALCAQMRGLYSTVSDDFAERQRRLTVIQLKEFVRRLTPLGPFGSDARELSLHMALNLLSNLREATSLPQDEEDKGDIVDKMRS